MAWRDLAESMSLYTDLTSEFYVNLVSSLYKRVIESSWDKRFNNQIELIAMDEFSAYACRSPLLVNPNSLGRSGSMLLNTMNVAIRYGRVELKIEEEKR